jgi:superfamily I DNA/RNA helicase
MPSEMSYSKYQENIFKFIQEEKGHAFVEAVAGSGKTTTIVEAANRIPQNSKAIFLAFNKHIATELGSRLPMNCEAKTLHSLGFNLMKSCGTFPRYIKVNANKNKNLFLYKVLEDEDLIKKKYAISYNITRVISLLKGLYVTEPTREDIVGLCDNYDIDVMDMDEFAEFAIEVFYLSINQTSVIDFDDMLFMPVHHDIAFPKYDNVFVDEAQDLNPIQIEIISRLNGRVIAVGDTHQAIYGFRGADPYAVEKMVNTFSAIKLPLSICYRCAKNIVNLAKELVPHIECNESQIDGEIVNIKIEDLPTHVTEGDYILCRTTAPLVSMCLRLLRLGKMATVKGRDIGEGLINFIDTVNKGSTDINDFYNSLNEYVTKKMGEYEARNKTSSIIELQDKYDTIDALSEEVKTVEELKAKVKGLFSDEVSGIVLSTIHKSKGLETDNVYILKPEILPHPKAKLDWQITQEKNLKYVAITRAKKKLCFVNG